MKIQTKVTALICLLLVTVMLFAACNTNKVDAEGRWADAVYLNDTEFGEGSKTVKVTVKAGDDEVIFTIHTDKTYLGDALLEHGLIDGDKGEFGIYIKKVNGILADYDADRSYWALWVDGAVSYYGADQVKMTDGAHYKLVYTVE